MFNLLLLRNVFNSSSRVQHYYCSDCSMQFLNYYIVKLFKAVQCSSMFNRNCHTLNIKLNVFPNVCFLTCLFHCSLNGLELPTWYEYAENCYKYQFNFISNTTHITMRPLQQYKCSSFRSFTYSLALLLRTAVLIRFVTCVFISKL